MARRIRFTRIITDTQQIADEIGKLQFSGYHGANAEWAPAVDVYRYADRYEVLAELAGIRREEIELTVQPRQLTIEGRRRRRLPDCPEGEAESDCRQTIAMEIATGRFERRIQLPEAVDPEKVSARQEDGLLRISLPLARAGKMKITPQ